jgi:hypothetical protein
VKIRAEADESRCQPPARPRAFSMGGHSR